MPCCIHMWNTTVNLVKNTGNEIWWTKVRDDCIFKYRLLCNFGKIENNISFWVESLQWVLSKWDCRVSKEWNNINFSLLGRTKNSLNVGCDNDIIVACIYTTIHIQIYAATAMMWWSRCHMHTNTFTIITYAKDCIKMTDGRWLFPSFALISALYDCIGTN